MHQVVQILERKSIVCLEAELTNCFWHCCEKLVAILSIYFYYLELFQIICMNSKEMVFVFGS
jgi:hypothetical protein